MPCVFCYSSHKMNFDCGNLLITLFLKGSDYAIVIEYRFSSETNFGDFYKNLKVLEMAIGMYYL